jgi:hypothetical protein
VKLTFLAPTNDGGSPVTSFSAHCGTGPENLGENANGTRSPLTVEGLQVDVEQVCFVTADNQAGQSPRGAAAKPVTVAFPKAPSAPRNVKATALEIRPTDGRSNGRVRLTFDPPANNGGSPVTSFSAHCGTGPQNLGENANGTKSPLTVEGLQVDVEQVCFVTADNKAGQGPQGLAEKPVTVTFPGVPSAPRRVNAEAVAVAATDGQADGRIEVSFDVPEKDGGAAITGFSAHCGTGPDNVGQSTRGPASPLLVTGLQLEVELVCSVTADNQAGTSPPGTAEPVTLSAAATVPPEPAPTAGTPGPPGAPREVEARALPLRSGDGQRAGRVDVGFVEPENDGGSPLTTFTARCTLPVGGAQTTELVAVGSGPASPVTVAGLQTDFPYTCAVSASNAAGLEGPATFAERPVTVPGRPGPPRDVRARALPLGSAGPQAGRAEVSFGAPEEKGAPPITGFVARCEVFVPSPRAGEAPERLLAEGSATTSPVTVTGLVVDFAYECSVRAVNRIGEGQGIRAAERVAVAGNLGQAGDVRAKALPLRPGDGADDGRVDVSFAAPGGSAPPATSFSVSCVSPESNRRFGPPLEAGADGSASPVTVPGIRVDRNYTCSVTAINQAGRGQAAFAQPVSVPGKPGPVRAIEVKALPLREGDGADDGRVEVTFLPPDDNGSPPVTSFSARCRSRPSRSTRPPHR